MSFSIEIIGFVGLGPMGHGLASNVLKKGVQGLVLGHRNRAPVESLVAQGAQEIGSLGELARRASIVFLCLPSSTEVEGTIMGADGLAAHMVPGQLIVDCSTASPVSTIKIGKHLESLGIGFLDAPLTRTPKEAEEGRLNVILGGGAQDIERVRPVIDLFAENVFLSGALGSAHKLKLINNFMSIGCSLVVAEAILAARAAGVDVRLLHQLASMGGANSGALQQIAPWVLDGQMNFRFAIRNAKKDIDYFAAMSGTNGAVGEAISAILDSAVGEGQGDLFIPQLIDLLTNKFDALSANKP